MRLFPSADQTMLSNPFHPFMASSRFSPVSVERNWIVPFLGPPGIMARCKPSGDKLQLQSQSIWGGSLLFPLRTSNRNVSEVFPFLMLYRQIVDGKGAHCTFQMRTSLRTRRGVPPPTGIAKMEDGVSRSPDFEVEIYKISVPSVVARGCKSCSALVIRFSARGCSMPCLHICG